MSKALVDHSVKHNYFPSDMNIVWMLKAMEVILVYRVVKEMEMVLS
jgi:hypothetical protein